MNTSVWSSVLLVALGGVLSVCVPIVGAFLSDRLGRAKTRRDELLTAYSEWAKTLHTAIDEAKHMWLYDEIEKQKHQNPQLTMSSSMSGRTREEHARDYLRAMTDLRGAKVRLILLEKRQDYVGEAIALSEVSHPGGIGLMTTVSDLFLEMRKRAEEVDGFLERIATTHPRLR